MEPVVLLLVAGLAFANGANDNFKGVATLHGSGATSYRTALIVATVATVGGSLLSIAFASFASGLIAAFSGSELVSADVAAGTRFTASVGGAAAITILLATRLGMPASTTHALTGALLGVAFVVDGVQSAWQPLVQRFFVPLLVSPLIAIVLTALAFYTFARMRARFGPDGPSCLCVAGSGSEVPAAAGVACAVASPSLVVAPVAECETLGPGAIVARSDRIAAAAHVLSAASVCFARAVNDTPKVAALLATASLAQGSRALGLVALAMAIGGIVASRRVAETISRGITSLDPVEGLSATWSPRAW